jgi:hypothetical protein
MKTALDTPASQLDEQERNFVENIREHGWYRMSVFADDQGPAFSYTTGFYLKFGFPELIVFSFRSELAHEVLWDVYRDLEAGRRYPVGSRVSDLFGNSNAYLLPVSQKHYATHLGWSRWFYRGDDFPCLQLLWPDRLGLFPWQTGASEDFKFSQPDLTSDGWVKSLGQ